MLDHKAARRLRQGAHAACALICAAAALALAPAVAHAQLGQLVPAPAPPAPQADSLALGGDAAHRNAWAGTGLRPPLEVAWTSPASPVVAALAVGPRVIVQTQAALAALDAATGTVLWVRPISAPPVELTTEGGRVYLTSSGGVAALNITDGSVVWFEPDTGATGPVVDAGRVVYGNAAGELVARAAPSGAELWRTSVGITGARPAVSGPRAYATGACRGVSVDVALGLELWSTGCDATTGTRTVLAGTTVISEDGALYDNADGVEQFPAGGPGTVGAGLLFANPLPAPPTQLLARDAATFGPRWTWTPPVPAKLLLRPAVVEDKVWQVVDAGEDGLLLGALEAATGEQRWTGYLPGDGSFAPATTSAVAVSSAKLLLVPTPSGLVALRNATKGQLGVRATLPRNVVPAGEKTVVSGTLVSDGHGLVGPRRVQLQADPFPFAGKGYKTLGSALARRAGFSFSAPVRRNTRFRLVAEGRPFAPTTVYAQPSIDVKYAATKVDLTVIATLRIAPEPGFKRAGTVGLYRLKDGDDVATRIGLGRAKRNGVAKFKVRIPPDLTDSDRVLPCLLKGSRRGFGAPNVLDRFCGKPAIAVPVQASSLRSAGLSLSTGTGSAMPLKRFMPASEKR